MKETDQNHPFGKLGNPAQRALANAGIKTVEDLAKLTKKQVMGLHGVGPSSLPTLQAALAEKGLSFAQ